ncbi:MAG: 50S ribosomal protein L24 [Puniceicoccales bacterium]|nr:50S ribosomal protein L24 [Puniceicoccales bacterium]
MKYNLKKDSEVVVISGAHKGKKGKILKVFRETQKVLVEGVNLRKKHLKKTQENATGSIVEKEMPIHYSNVMSLAEVERRTQKRSAPLVK